MAEGRGGENREAGTLTTVFSGRTVGIFNGGAR